MIDFRYHLVSIVAVFLALAIGIVLGSTELQGAAGAVLRTANSSLTSQLNATRSERDSDAAQASAYAAQVSAGDVFLKTSESRLLDGGRLLAGNRLVIVTEPGAPDAVTNGVKTAAADAGAVVTGEVALQSTFNELSGPTGATLSSINLSVAASDGTTLAAGTDPQTTYQQDAAQLIATAILEKPESQQQNQQGQAGLSAASARTLLNAYAQAGFITVNGSPANRAGLVVIIAPGSVPADGASDPTNQVLVAIGREFAGSGAVTVIAGATTPSGQAGSAISVVRASPVARKVSTVDNADRTQGQITVMQAIAAQVAGGQPSSYGVSGAASVAPSPAPTAPQTPTASTQPANAGNGGKKGNNK
ncbi:MAG TPA: copper transporter [Trebonia sp.]|nr:copper transporter [Trebonia sp.]